jgi:hypothetical protein
MPPFDNFKTFNANAAISHDVAAFFNAISTASILFLASPKSIRELLL